MPSSLPRLGIRIDRDLLDKFHFVASYNERTANKEIEYVVKRHIALYEAEHGTIQVPAEVLVSETD